MGLSGEEVVRGFLGVVASWRRSLLALAAVLGREVTAEDTGERCVGTVARWVRELDRLAGVGAVLAKKRHSGINAIIADSHRLAADADPTAYPPPRGRETGTIDWWLDAADYAVTASRLQAGKVHHRGLDALAKWWDAYSHVPDVARYLWHYGDDVFSDEVREGVLVLVGEMFNRRYDVCFGFYDAEEVNRVERYLLAKHHVVRELLDGAAVRLRGAAYFEESFDAEAVYGRVAAMSARELEQFYAAEARRGELAGVPGRDEARADGLFGTPAAPPKGRKLRRRRGER